MLNPEPADVGVYTGPTASKNVRESIRFTMLNPEPADVGVYTGPMASTILRESVRFTVLNPEPGDVGVYGGPTASMNVRVTLAPRHERERKPHLLGFALATTARLSGG